MDFSSICQRAESKPLIITARLAVAGGCVLLSTPRGVIMAVRQSSGWHTYIVYAHTFLRALRLSMQVCKAKPIYMQISFCTHSMWLTLTFPGFEQWFIHRQHVSQCCVRPTVPVYRELILVKINLMGERTGQRIPTTRKEMKMTLNETTNKTYCYRSYSLYVELKDPKMLLSLKCVWIHFGEYFSLVNIIHGTFIHVANRAADYIAWLLPSCVSGRSQ